MTNVEFSSKQDKALALMHGVYDHMMLCGMPHEMMDKLREAAIHVRELDPVQKVFINPPGNYDIRYDMNRDVLVREPTANEKRLKDMLNDIFISMVDCEAALNSIPRQTLSIKEYTSTYDLARHLYGVRQAYLDLL